MGPTRPTTKTIIFNEADDCFYAMDLSFMAQLRRNKAVESEENVHRRARKNEKGKRSGHQWGLTGIHPMTYRWTHHHRRKTK
jgi:hypothetical protein